jgi:hypothetical protein
MSVSMNWGAAAEAEMRGSAGSLMSRSTMLAAHPSRHLSIIDAGCQISINVMTTFSFRIPQFYRKLY